MATLPLPTLAAQIGATGISAPAFEDVLNSEIATYQSIYGSDTVLTSDTQDGELLSIRATAINDLNQLAVAVYNSFSPDYAQGTGLSSLVQINGLQRINATNSTVSLNIAGVVGTPIQDGVVIDAAGNLWDLPALVTIPESGEIEVTATAQQAGAITAAVGAVNQPYTIITGWQIGHEPIGSNAGHRRRNRRGSAPAPGGEYEFACADASSVHRCGHRKSDRHRTHSALRESEFGPGL